MSNVTKILSAIEQTDSTAADKLLPLMDQELRKLARFDVEKQSEDLLAINEASTRLEEQWSEKAKLVKMKCFSA